MRPGTVNKISTAFNEAANMTWPLESIMFHQKKEANNLMDYIVIKFKRPDKFPKGYNIRYDEKSDIEGIFRAIINRAKFTDRKNHTSYVKQLEKRFKIEITLDSKDSSKKLHEAVIFYQLGKHQPYEEKIKNDIKEADEDPRNLDFVSVVKEEGVYRRQAFLMFSYKEPGNKVEGDNSENIGYITKIQRVSYDFSDYEGYAKILKLILENLTPKFKAQLVKNYKVETEDRGLDEQVEMLKVNIEDRKRKELKDKVIADFKKLGSDERYYSMCKSDSRIEINFINPQGEIRKFGYSSNANSEADIFKNIATNLTDEHKQQFKERNGFSIEGTEEEKVAAFQKVIIMRRQIHIEEAGKKTLEIKKIISDDEKINIQYRFRSIITDADHTYLNLLKNNESKVYAFPADSNDERLEAIKAIISNLKEEFSHQIAAVYKVSLNDDPDKLAEDILNKVKERSKPRKNKTQEGHIIS